MADYIDREKLLDYIDVLFAEDGKGYYVVTSDEIWKIPTADVAPVVRGRWLTWDEKFPEKAAEKRLGVFCSVCGNREDFSSPYCPNCGAKMEKKS